ncbi:protein ALWAYS EARLY 2-like isoform X1 [Tripterygium wilfordii]|uniref:Protein ALWAYS EARLY 2-like isoform X1 n=1 Tax=Tripterygium wilfordii TaxID=458696 RepID=A0A7J7D0U3_TRIWF|nr:protein ALWAYS EARLY 2 isoform X2 [Tripterygium wilfordii]KAF5739859.1 protein ALWAYS EARLY 2-like isoform X1 [Tripterygium wilfordii]
MGPARKSRSVNKRFSNVDETSPGNSNKSKQKRKLSDKLGSRWNKGELQSFYEAYRKYGKDWKKVAAALQNRSVEMVEGLYHMNKAYLSLPEGTASVVGLIAMMTDHYNVMEASDNERESNEVSVMPSQPQKCKRAKIQQIGFKENLLPRSKASSDGCLASLKKVYTDGGQPLVVKKRTPRFPTFCMRDDAENHVSPKTIVRAVEADTNGDEGAHVAALALTEASLKGGSPPVSRAANRRMELIKSPAVTHFEREMSQSENGEAKLHDSSIRGNLMESGVRVRVAENSSSARDTITMVDMEGLSAVEIHRKGKKIYRKKGRVEMIQHGQSDDEEEACSGTKGLRVNSLNGDAYIAVSNTKDEQISHGQRKRSKKLFTGDESHALYALQMLADVSLREIESSVQLKDEKIIMDEGDKFDVHGTASISLHKGKTKNLGSKEKVFHAITTHEDTSSRKSKLGKNFVFVSGTKMSPQVASNKLKRKRNSLLSERSDVEAHTDSHLRKSLEPEVLAEEEYIFKMNGRQSDQISSSLKQWQSVGAPGDSSIDSYRTTLRADLEVSTTQVSSSSQVSFLPSKRSRRKMDLKRTFSPKEMKTSDNTMKFQDNILKEKLCSCLSSRLVQKWCISEWFYSSIDYPWFAKREFVEYLNHVGLGHIPRLTRVEWGVIRSSLGKPRRFSERFLCEEREKLNQYRDSVRKHYSELRSGIREGLPTDLAWPLSVGQQVIAVHPKTRDVNCGKVLTVDHDKCRVQFDRPEIGVGFVMDIDCMPANPLDNMPEVLRRRRFPIPKELQAHGHSNSGGSMTFTSCGHQERPSSPMNTLVKQAETELSISQPKATTNNVSAQAAYIRSSNLASSALPNLRQQNTCKGSLLPPWLKPQAVSNFQVDLSISPESSVSQESGSSVVEIVRRSRSKAHTMVNAAMQAMSSLKEGEDAFMRIGASLESVDKRQLTSDSRVPMVRSSEHVNGTLDHCKRSITCTSEPQLACSVSGSDPRDETDKNDAKISSELITSCVSTLLMIQTCTERQYPPADVAQIIDSAVTSLRPCCPQNLPIYREIQMCMGRIKTQILALIPT